MRVGVDIRSLLSPVGRGVSHYTLSLLGELIARHPGDQWVLVATGRRRLRLPPELQRPNVTLRHLRLPNKLLNLSLALTGRPRLDRLLGPGVVDVFFAPNLGFVKVSPGVPLVVTVHDLSFRLFPRYYTWRERIWHRAIRPYHLLKRAQAVITVSAQTKAEVEDIYGLLAKQISVVHSGIDPAYRKTLSTTERLRIRRKYRLPERYLLFLGALEPRKNLPTVLAAFATARTQGLKAELVLAGQPSAALKRLARQPGVRLLGYVPEGDKPVLYAEALALVLASLHEGFGFPPLEALACGTPSIVSDLPVFAETLGAAALRVDPTDSGALARNLVDLERSTALRKRLVRFGASKLRQLTWQQSADLTYRVLRAAANHPIHEK